MSGRINQEARESLKNLLEKTLGEPVSEERLDTIEAVIRAFFSGTGKITIEETRKMVEGCSGRVQKMSSLEWSGVKVKDLLERILKSFLDNIDEDNISVAAPFVRGVVWEINETKWV